VVIAIISVLAALLAPSLKSARNSARQVECLNQLHQLHLVLSLYSSENRDLVPMALDASTIAWGTRLALSGYIAPNGVCGPSVDSNHFVMTKTPARTLLCPASTVLWGGYPDWLRGHYGLNTIVAGESSGFSGPGFALSSISNPANIILLIDSGAYEINWFWTTSASDPFYLPGAAVNQLGVFQPEDMNDALRGRHGKRDNVMFIDGHAISMDPNTLTNTVLWVP
jgi:prepilin-type processing-associated H-X9-DG protein